MKPLAVSYAEAARLLGKSKRTICRLVEERVIPVVRIPRTRPVIPYAALEKLLGVSPEPARKMSERELKRRMRAGSVFLQKRERRVGARRESLRTATPSWMSDDQASQSPTPA